MEALCSECNKIYEERKEELFCLIGEVDMICYECVKKINQENEKCATSTCYQKKEPMKIKPLSDYYVLKKFKEEKKAGLLIVPESDKEPLFYEVVGVPDSNCVSIGDKVIVGSYCGKTIEIDGEEYMIVKSEYLFAIME
jgi:chaperonin GroES